MGNRKHLLLLVIASLLLGAMGSMAAIGVTAQTADACSIAGPHLEVSPSTNLMAGDTVEITGWSFVDLVWTDSPPQPEPVPGGDIAVPPALCDFQVIAMNSLEIRWHGSTEQILGVIDGPDFHTRITIPNDGTAGSATIAVGDAKAAVFLGAVVEPPPPPPPLPCPLAASTGQTQPTDCPEPWPWPCPYDVSQTAPAPEIAPGFLPECCIDAAHTDDAGTAYDYRWDCPDPCSYPQVDPGAPRVADSWCPPPDPCVAYLDGFNDVAPAIGCPEPCEVVGGDAVWCPPEPCLALFEVVDQPRAAIECPPEPCEVVGGDALWCPPEPCPVYTADADVPVSSQAWCPPPDPCLVHFDGLDEGRPAIGCPEPCQLIGGDAIWCPQRDDVASSGLGAAPPQIDPVPDTSDTSEPAVRADAVAIEAETSEPSAARNLSELLVRRLTRVLTSMFG